MRPYLGYIAAAIIAIGLYASHTPRLWLTVYTLGIIAIIAATEKAD